MNTKTNQFRHRKKIIIEPEIVNHVNYKLLIELGLILWTVLFSGGVLRFMGIALILVTFQFNYILNWIEELQLKNCHSVKDLALRMIVCYQVKNLLVEEAEKERALWNLAVNGRILIPFVNVYITYENHRFKGKVEIELTHTFTQMLSDDLFVNQLNSALQNVAEGLRAKSHEFNKTGNSVIFELEDTAIDDQIEISSVNNLINVGGGGVVLDASHEFDWNKIHHGIVSGVTGAGKSTLIEYMIANAMLNDYEIVIIDPKQSDLSLIKNSRKVKVAWECEDIMQLLEDTLAEMKEVQRSYHQNPEGKLKQHLIVIDELAALKVMVNKEQQKRLDEIMKQIALLGRQLKFHLLLGMQQANANNVSTEIREQMGLRVLLGNSTEAARKFLFPDDDIQVESENKLGQGILSINGSIAEKFQAPLIKVNLIELINEKLLKVK